MSQLITDGRIILEGTGPNARVKVAESLKLIEETQGNRSDMTAKHARARSEKRAAASTDGEFKSVGASYQTARAVREKYAALTAKAQYETMIGNLIEREDVAFPTVAVGVAIPLGGPDQFAARSRSRAVSAA